MERVLKILVHVHVFCICKYGTWACLGKQGRIVLLPRSLITTASDHVSSTVVLYFTFFFFFFLKKKAREPFLKFCL
jgi:hypothetical protein